MRIPARMLVASVVAAASTTLASNPVDTPEHSILLNDYWSDSADWTPPSGWPLLGQVNEYVEDFGSTESIRWHGDELGYAANGVGDVDGDGFNDLAVCYYFRNRVLNGQDNPKTGKVEVISGKTGERIGEPIWGEHEDVWLAHSIAHIDLPLPGEPGGSGHHSGTSEIILGTSRAKKDGSGDLLYGAVYVYAYTDEFNLTGSGKKWVNVLTIRGKKEDPTDPRPEFGFSVSDGHHDFNGDGENDLFVKSRRYNDDAGAAWMFCMPDEQVWADHFDTSSSNWHGGSGDAALDGNGTVVPGVTIDSNAAGLFVTGDMTDPGGNFAGAGGDLHDVDGDEVDEFAIGSTAYNSGYGKLYVFLSDSVWQSGDKATDVGVSIESDTNGKAIAASNRIDISASDAHVIFAGSDHNRVGGVAGGDFNGDGDLDLITGGGDPQNNRHYKSFLFNFEKRIAQESTFPADPHASVTINVDPSSMQSGSDLIDKPDLTLDDDIYGYGLRPRGNVGDANGDGYPELMVQSDAVSFKWARPAMMFLNLATPSSGDYDVVLEAVAEDKWTSGDRELPSGDWKVPTGIRGEDLGTSAKFISPWTLRAWPAWDVDGNGKTDMLLAARVYPWPIPPIEESDTDGTMQWDLTDADNVTHLGQTCPTITTPNCAGSKWTNYLNAGYDNVYHDFVDGSMDVDHDPFAAVGKMYLVLTPPFFTRVEPDEVEEDSTVTITLRGADLNPPKPTGFTTSDITIETFLSELGTLNIQSVTKIDDEELEVSIDVGTELDETARDVSIETNEGTLTLTDALVVVDAPSPIVGGDVDGDGLVSFKDMTRLLARFGESGDELDGDLDGDSDVDADDLRLLIGAFD